MDGFDRSTGRDREPGRNDAQSSEESVARLTERQLWQLAAGREVTVGDAVSPGERIRIEVSGFDAASVGFETDP
jgi:hypothetical protein